MAKNRDPRPAAVRAPRGGWRHPLALVLLLAAVVWAVGTFFTVSDADFPGIGAIPGLFALGGWNAAVAAVLGFAALSVADRTRPAKAPGESQGMRYAAPLMVASALIGLVWIVVFYVISGTAVDIPVYSDLGDWNILIGMGFIIAAFGFATKWE